MGKNEKEDDVMEKVPWIGDGKVTFWKDSTFEHLESILRLSHIRLSRDILLQNEELKWESE